MQHLVDTYVCEWADVVRDPEKRAAFRHFANDPRGDDNVRFVTERGQPRPADPPSQNDVMVPARRRLPVVRRRWVPVASVADVPLEGGIAVRHGEAQIAVFQFASRGEWYATQNLCPHKRQMVLARGILGDQGGTPKVACPMHKKTFDLQSGACLSGEDYALATFPVRTEDGVVYVELPPAEELGADACSHRDACASEATASAP
jgi:nitrite reductase (NADH) large subunit